MQDAKRAKTQTRPLGNGVLNYVGASAFAGLVLVSIADDAVERAGGGQGLAGLVGQLALDRNDVGVLAGG